MAITRNKLGTFAGFDITLDQRGPDNFTVHYGQQHDANLDYAQAAAKLGQAIMHAWACEGRIDNRRKAEARRGRNAGAVTSDLGGSRGVPRSVHD